MDFDMNIGRVDAVCTNSPKILSLLSNHTQGKHTTVMGYMTVMCA